MKTFEGMVPAVPSSTFVVLAGWTRPGVIRAPAEADMDERTRRAEGAAAAAESARASRDSGLRQRKRRVRSDEIGARSSSRSRARKPRAQWLTIGPKTLTVGLPRHSAASSTEKETTAALRAQLYRCGHHPAPEPTHRSDEEHNQGPPNDDRLLEQRLGRPFSTRVPRPEGRRKHDLEDIALSPSGDNFESRRTRECPLHRGDEVLDADGLRDERQRTPLEGTQLLRLLR